MIDTTLQAGGERLGTAPYDRTAGIAASASPSAVAWGAVLAGAVGAAALAMILLILGTGLGLSSVSPFSGQGAGAETFGWSAIAWLTFTQLAASGIGGYLAGRLRTRWISTHVDEVYFRDTAHGFLAWGVATLVTAALLTSTVSAIVGAGARTAGTAVAGMGAAATAAAGPAMAMAGNSSGTGSNGAGYFVDSLFRQNMAGATAGSASAPGMPSQNSANGSGMPPPPPMMGTEGGNSNGEATRIMLSGLQSGTLPANDVTYLGQMIAQKTGISQADAEKRVNDTFAAAKAKADQAKADAKEAADKARKAGAYAALWLFFSLLLGAFVASLSATFGGRQRDLV